MKIIGITGASGSGKDTAYNLIHDHLSENGYVCTKLYFASKLKDICTLMFGWDRERLVHDVDYKEGDTLDNGQPDPACELLGMTRRVVMQRLGTEAMREGLHQDIWIIALKLAIMNGEYDDYDVGVITDCRFLNEIKFIKDMDGTLLKIERSGDRGETLTTQTEHLSETEWRKWSEWDYTVKNHVVSSLSNEENLQLFKKNLAIALDMVWDTDMIPAREKGFIEA